MSTSLAYMFFVIFVVLHSLFLFAFFMLEVIDARLNSDHRPRKNCDIETPNQDVVEKR